MRAHPSGVLLNREAQGTGPCVRCHLFLLSHAGAPLSFTTNGYPSTKPPQRWSGLLGMQLSLHGFFRGSCSLAAEVRICLASFIPASSLPSHLSSLPVYIATGLGALCQSIGFSRESSSFGWASFWRAPAPVGCILTIPHPKRLSAVPMDRISGVRVPARPWTSLSGSVLRDRARAWAPRCEQW